MSLEFDDGEMSAAAKMSAACEHAANEYGVCVFCGALRPDDPSKTWEPPTRRPRIAQRPEPTPRAAMMRLLHEFRATAKVSPYTMGGVRIVTLSADSIVTIADAMLEILEQHP